MFLPLCAFLLANQAGAAPLIDLDPDNSAGKSPGFAATFTEGDDPIPLADQDAVLQSPEGEDISAMLVSIADPRPGDRLSADTSGTQIIADFSSGVLTLTGPETPAIYETVLRSIVFENDSENPDDTPRVIGFSAASDGGDSDLAFTDLAVVPVNDPPVHAVPGPQVTPRNIPLTFSAIDGNALQVSDPDLNGGNLATALSVSRGTLTAEGDSDATVERNGTSAIVITGTQGAVNVELEGLRYDPPSDWHGIVAMVLETDDMGNTGIPGPMTDRDEVEITVAVTVGPNNPPVADAGTDLVADEYQKVALDGSGSFDSDEPDEKPVAYQWRQTGGTPVDLEDADTPAASFTAPETGAGGEVLIFSLTVFDSRDQTDVDQVEVVVRDIGEPMGTFPEGSTVILNAPEAGAGSVSVAWMQVSGPSVALSDAASKRPSFVAPIVEPGGAMLVFQITVKDADGAEISDKAPVRIEDNGITGFPPDVLTFPPILSAEMGIAAGGGHLVSLRGLDPTEIKETRNRPQSLAYGLVECHIKMEQPGTGASLTFYLSEPAGEEFNWFGYTEAEGWFKFGSNAVFSLDRTRVTLMITDGALADRDEDANGIIQVLSGLGKSGAQAPSESGGSGDTGGCFIRSANSLL